MSGNLCRTGFNFTWNFLKYHLKNTWNLTFKFEWPPCRKYVYFENKHCIFWSKHGCLTASLDILNTKRLITPEREGFRGSNFDRFILGLYKLTY